MDEDNNHHNHSHNHNHNHNHHHNHEQQQQQQEENADDDREADRRHLEDVICSFRYYRNDGMSKVTRMGSDFRKLSEAHQSLLRDYPGKLAAMRQCVDGNTAFINLLLNDVHLFNRRLDDDDDDDGKEEGGKSQPTVESLDKVHSTLRQFMRDWTKAGEVERQRCYAPLIAEVERRFPLTLPQDLNKYRVLVPGCGLARLVWEFAFRGYAVQGNEFSYHMLIGSNWVLNRSGNKDVAAIFPWALTCANRVMLGDQFQRYLVPDVETGNVPEGVDMSMNAGEFVLVYQEPQFAESFHVVAAPFFLDTAHNPIDYLQTIWKILRPGGIWINFGPLLWHYSDMPGEVQIEVSLAELLDLVKAIGFQVEMQSPVPCSYATDRSSMMQTAYNCAHFIAVKPQAKE